MKPAVTEEQIIKGCQRGERRAQKALYDRYAPKMFGVCIRYVKDRVQAEEVLVAAMFKAMTKIDRYGSRGSFEGWVRKITVNECLMFLRSHQHFRNMVEVQEIDLRTEEHIETELAVKELKALLATLPLGYRTVFNLYVIEGYKHREIADMLGISIHTSKSQLLLAKRRMRELIEQRNYHEAG